ncbi:MAG: hypothetical protein ABSH28_22380 [Acidobacteriota bacterium]
MKRFVLILVVCMLFTLPLMAQSQPAQQNGGVWDVISDPNNIAPAAFLLSNLADAKTDWHFTGPITHKEYVITPAQRLGIAGGSIFAAYTIRHYFPNTAKPINIALAIATAYFAGRAYANTFNHGEPALPAPAVKGQEVAFSYQFPIKR